MKKFVCILVMALTLVACSESEAQSPKETINSFFNHAIEGEFSDMEKYISDTILTAMETRGYGMNAYANDITEDGKIKSIEVIKENIKGEGATVKYIAVYKDGSEKENSVSLIKEDKSWKVSPE